ncbi:MAG: 5-deoxy-glucuronate isomerase [Anaerolineae bacterium]|nr:5-deoxy-glucuronate isomerase [Anaerolineae bacterium]
MTTMSLVRRGQREPGPEGHLVGVSPTDAGWQYIHFDAYRLPASGTLRRATGDHETALVVLSGQCTVHAPPHTYENIGRRSSVWERIPPYVVLLPPGTEWRVEAKSQLHLAVASAPADPVPPLPPRLITPEEIVAEHRGEGQTYRFIQHLLPPSATAARLILVEVYTPAGHWSSFPPHKHDTEAPPDESYLEETYYYQIHPPTGFAFQRVYTPERDLDVAVAAGNGDLVVVPRGYHPVAASPGYDCYYLNVMAGPTRAWNFKVDPDYAHLMNWQKPAVAEMNSGEAGR